MAFSADRTRATVVGAWLEGWRRVIHAPAVAASVLVMTLALAAPLAFTLNGMLAEHLGSSMEAEHAQWNWDEGWANEFQQQAQGIGRTFTHEILDFGGTIKIVSDILDRQSLNPALAGAVAAYLAIWLFLSGGIIDRLARGRPVRTAAFFATCGVYFVRFARLTVVMAAVYWALFARVYPLLFDRVYPHFVRNITLETHAIALRISLYVLFGLLLIVANMIFDYAKIRAVVEDRRSMISALLASFRFVRRRAWRTLGLYGVNSLAFLIIIRIWYEAAPAATMSPWPAFAIAQIYLLARVWAKLAFIASETTFFQGELAHAGYTAAPPLVWPESASAEAIRNLAKG